MPLLLVKSKNTRICEVFPVVYANILFVLDSEHETANERSESEDSAVQYPLHKLIEDNDLEGAVSLLKRRVNFVCLCFVDVGDRQPQNKCLRRLLNEART